jgi:transcription antitermination protein NusB
MSDKKTDRFYYHSNQDLTPEEAKLKIETDEIFENDPDRDKKLSRRRLARERVMQAIYSKATGNGSDTDQLFTLVIASDDKLGEQGTEFARDLLRRFSLHEEEVNAVITERLANWDFSRVALIDKILLQIGITEFKYFPEIPPKATINELIEIAKDFSTDESSKFINGILHKVKDDLAEKGELNKEGRGLIDQSL